MTNSRPTGAHGRRPTSAHHDFVVASTHPGRARSARVTGHVCRQLVSGDHLHHGLLSATWLDSYSLAYTVASLLNQLFGKGKEPFWQLAYTNLVRWIIELYRVLPGGWVTLRDVYHCAIDKELFARKITQAQTYAADMSDTWITIRRRR